MIEAVEQLINGVDDVAARPRLRRCLPPLSRVLVHFDGRVASEGLTIAAATPVGATVLHADGWPERVATELTTGEVALGLRDGAGALRGHRERRAVLRVAP